MHELMFATSFLRSLAMPGSLPKRLAPRSLVVAISIILVSMAGCGRPADQAITANQSNPAGPNILDKVIHFDASHEADPYKVSGWSPTEQNFTWTLGKAAVLAVPIPPDSGPLRLRMLVAAYTHPPELPAQLVEVYVNGQKVADWNVASPAQNYAVISREIVARGSILTIQLRTPKAASPAEFSAKGDERVLGICCSEMELMKLSP